jgi:hypothetical protein
MTLNWGQHMLRRAIRRQHEQMESRKAPWYDPWPYSRPWRRQRTPTPHHAIRTASLTQPAVVARTRLDESVRYPPLESRVQVGGIALGGGSGSRARRGEARVSNRPTGSHRRPLYSPATPASSTPTNQKIVYRSYLHQHHVVRCKARLFQLLNSSRMNSSERESVALHFGRVGSSRFHISMNCTEALTNASTRTLPSLIMGLLFYALCAPRSSPRARFPAIRVKEPGSLLPSTEESRILRAISSAVGDAQYSRCRARLRWRERYTDRAF